MSQHVWIAQCLCPARHCIMAMTGEADSKAEATAAILGRLRIEVETALLTERVNAHCALCNAKSDTWNCEVGRTPFRTLEAARPVLERLQAEQLIVNALFGDMPTGRPN